MKTIAITLIVVMGMLALLNGSVSGQTFDHSITMMEDVTDTAGQWPQFDAVQTSLRLDEDPWQGIQMRYVQITDLELNRSQEFTLESKFWLWNNELQRKKEVKQFLNGFSALKNDDSHVSTGRSRSSIYASLAKELNRLAQTDAESKRLIIYSDLTENTQDVSMYKKDTLDMVEHQPNDIRDMLSRSVALDRLDGVSVYLIYEPQNRLQDKRFSIISRFYKSWLEEHGAKVFIQASLSLTP